MVKRLLFPALIVFLLISAAIYSLNKLNKGVALNLKGATIPTVFIHGYAGGDRSLHGMIRRFNEKYHVGTETLTIKVSSSGKLSIIGHYDKNSANPLINIVFNNSRASINQQSIWTKKVMGYLKKNYGINSFNAVGHSMGGGTWIAYLARYGKNPAYPQVNKIVFLAVPFYPEEYIDGANEINIRNASRIHMKFAKKMVEILPKNIDILMVVGNLGDGSKSDGQVEMDSVLYGKKLFKNQNIETRIITRSDATHSNMHEFTVIDHYVARFLFGK